MDGAVTTTRVDELAPVAAYNALKASRSAALVDVRTVAEWALTGRPDVSETGKPLLCIEWMSAPNMALNPDFFEQLRDQAGGDLPEQLFFLCRVGARSRMAARMVAAKAESLGTPVHCTNIAAGVDGDAELDGWKAQKLPWQRN